MSVVTDNELQSMFLQQHCQFMQTLILMRKTKTSYD